MDPEQESIIYEEIENALRESPSSATWEGVTELNITDTRSSYWRHYKDRICGVPAQQWVTNKCNINLERTLRSDDLDILIWREINKEMVQTLNSLFSNIPAADLNDERYNSVKLDEIENLYRLGLGNDVLLRNSVFVDVICDPILKKFSEKVGDVGTCCTTDWLRSKSCTTALNYLCAKRTDLSGTTDWVMKRYGGSRRESSIFMSVMFWATCNMFLSCGRFCPKLLVDSCIGMVNGITREFISTNDGDRTTHTVDKTELANAVESSIEKSVPTTSKLRVGLETVVAARKVYAKKYNDLYKEISCVADPKDMTPSAYLQARYVDGLFTTTIDVILHNEFGDAYDSVDGSIFFSSYASACHYNDLSDALMDMKYMETHNYVICAKTNANYSFSDHCEALYVALTTFDVSHNSYDHEIKKRMSSYRLCNILFFAIWPRYRSCERARRYVGTLSEEDRTKLIERGRRCLQGDIFIEENIWLDAICSNFNTRRAVIQRRGYIQTLLYVLGVEYDESAKNHIESAVEANGARPFDTGLELVTALGSEWLAELALQTINGTAIYHSLVAELSDLLTTLTRFSMPIISDNTITPCESICGPLCLRLMETLAVVLEINTEVGEAINRTVAAVITMVSLDPYRCLAHHADSLLLN